MLVVVVVVVVVVIVVVVVVVDFVLEMVAADNSRGEKASACSDS